MNYLKKLSPIILLIALTIFAECGSGAENNNNNGSPSFQTKAEELNYISKLSSDEISGVISGQNCGHGNQIATGWYDNFIERLHQQTGKYVGIIGIDYEYEKVYSLDELKQANTYLKSYWNKGGLVTIVWSPANPWGAKKTYEDIQTYTSPGDIKEIITEGRSKYAGWMASLDRIAAALADLKQEGVIVLWRPMQEMNGNWFWWGKYSLEDTKKYINVWKHMHNYLTNEKGLDNLIWVFSPSGTNSKSYPYPGDEYVDIIAPTLYHDELNISNYSKLVDYVKSHGKPIAIAEYGWNFTDSTNPDGNFDNTLYVRKLKNNYPEIAYWVTWHSWYGVKAALVDNLNASQLLNDPYVLNRDNL
jgi:mannan endo-1,4-beta-mannosidase